METRACTFDGLRRKEKKNNRFNLLRTRICKQRRFRTLREYYQMERKEEDRVLHFPIGQGV